MKITAIRYRRLQSHDRGYGHDAVEAEAQVDEGEDADDVASELRAWVLRRLETIKEVDQHIETLDRLRERVVAEERSLERVKKEIKAAEEVVSSHEKLAALARANGLGGEALLLDDALGQVPF